VEVTNGDECVTVKNTASNFLVENVHCNLSGGCAMGSLSLDTSITMIHYNHIYENGAGGHYIKSYGGSGTVSDSLFENFIVHNSAYTLTNNEYWDSANNAGGPGVFVTGLTYRVSTK
jgi:rhamnogalacturonan hydrolase